MSALSALNSRKSLVMKRLGAMLGLALVALATSPTQASVLIGFDPDGASGPSGVLQVESFTQAAGNAIAVDFNKAVAGGGFRLPTAGETFTLLYQAKGNTLRGPGNTGLYAYGIGNTNQLTYVAEVTELITSSGTTSTFLALTGSLKIYFNDTLVANDLAGTGFTAGRLIYEGTLNTNPQNVKNTGNFTLTDTNIGSLDKNGTDNYPGVQTVAGNGQTDLEFVTTLVDPTFFVSGVPSTLSLLLQDASTTNNLPFNQVDPSAQFFNGQAGVSSVGAINGGFGANFQPLAANVMFQSVAVASLNISAVPEPGTVASALAGLAMTGLYLRRRAKA